MKTLVKIYKNDGTPVLEDIIIENGGRSFGSAIIDGGVAYFGYELKFQGQVLSPSKPLSNEAA